MGQELCTSSHNKLANLKHNSDAVQKSKLAKNTFNYSKRKSRLQDSHLGTEGSIKGVLSKSYNKTKRIDKCSFDSDFLNSSQSIKFGLTGGSLEDSMDLNKSRSKCFAYKRSRIDKLVSDNIAKSKGKEERATLKKIKEVEEKISKRDETTKLNQQVRLKNAKKSKNIITRKQISTEGPIKEVVRVNSESKTSFQNPRAWREFFEVKKEVNNMDEKLFQSTDNVVSSKMNDLSRSNILKKSGSVDGTTSPTFINVFLRDSNGRNLLNERKIKIRSSKDLHTMNFNKSKAHCSKSRGQGKKGQKKIGDKL